MIDTTVGGFPPTGSNPSTFFQQRYTLETRCPMHSDGLPKFVQVEGRNAMLCHLKSTDPSTGGLAQRTEISAKREYTPPGEERWYALSFYLDQHWPIYDDKTRFVLLQLHTSQRTAVLQPPLFVSVLGKQMVLCLRHNTWPVAQASIGNSSQVVQRMDDLQLQRWYCFVVNTSWSWEEHVGSLRLWLNGRILHEELNLPNCYENLEAPLGNWPKVGVYAPGGFDKDRWGGKEAWVKSYVDYFTLAAPSVGLDATDLYAFTPYKGAVEKQLYLQP